MEATTLYTNLFPPRRNWSQRKPARKAKKQSDCRKFTKEEVLAIRNATETSREIARQYGCSETTIGAIRRHKTYTEYGGPVCTPKMEWANRATQIYIMRERGVPSRELAKQYGLTVDRVGRIYTREKQKRKQ